MLQSESIWPITVGYRREKKDWDGLDLCLHLRGGDGDGTVRTMKPITTSVYTFSKLIEGGFLYVDKTSEIHALLQPAFAQYFLARPRRFGKSLLISTLKAIFQGRRDLFEGLSIASTDYEWKPYPVIHLDMGSTAAQTAEELAGKLIYALDRNAIALGVSLQQAHFADRFLELVNTLTARDGRVVILVDEYDKPLLGHLGQPSAKPIQSVLKQFYSVIKTTEDSQRFALITGVSKFTKVSIFSDLNNLTDLTMDARSRWSASNSRARRAIWAHTGSSRWTGVTPRPRFARLASCMSRRRKTLCAEPSARTSPTACRPGASPQTSSPT